eukprot:15320217-Ditylum_brightwellii.AAC.1
MWGKDQKRRSTWLCLFYGEHKKLVGTEKKNGSINGMADHFNKGHSSEEGKQNRKMDKIWRQCLYQATSNASRGKLRQVWRTKNAP